MTGTPTSQHPALRIEPTTTRAVPIHCPNCAKILAIAWADKIDRMGDEPVYDNGDTIFGLDKKLITCGHVAKEEFLGWTGTWFDYGFSLGTCRFCDVDYFGATVSMIDPVCKRVTPDQAEGRDAAGTAEWCVDVYRTPDCGILHEHQPGPFAWPDDLDMPDQLCPSSEETSARQPMDWIGAHICDLWPAFRAAVIADNRQGDA